VRISLNFTKIEEILIYGEKCHFTSFSPRAGNVALAQGILGVLGDDFMKKWKMTKKLDFYQISPNFTKFS